MRRHVEVGPVQPRLVPVGTIDADLRVVRDQLRRHAAHEGECPRMGPDPVGQRLGPGRLGVGVAGGAHGGDEDLRLAHLPGPPVDDLDRLAGIVDEQPLAGRVRLAHGRRQPALPGPVELAPAAVGIAVRFSGAVLLPQQHERHAGPAQLAVDMGPVRLRLPPEALLAARAGIEHRLQHALAQRLRQRPGKPRRGKTVEGESHGAAGNAERARDRPVAGTTGMLQAQDLAHASHRHSLGWHRLPHPSLVRDGQEAADPPSGRATTTPRVAEFKSEWPTSRRNRRPASSRNQWPTCAGIGGRSGRRRRSARTGSASASAQPRHSPPGRS